MIWRVEMWASHEPGNGALAAVDAAVEALGGALVDMADDGPVMIPAWERAGRTAGQCSRP